MAAGGIYAKAVEGSAPVLLYLFLTPFLLMGLVPCFFGMRPTFEIPVRAK
jgi:hypothetical protein